MGLAAAVVTPVYSAKAAWYVWQPVPPDAAAGYDTEQRGTRRLTRLAGPPLRVLAFLAASLGVELRTIPIEAAHGAFLEMLAPSFAGLGEDLTEENLQSRIRAVLLMALSNKFGWIVLTTGNKSELATGYSTLYGDSAGGFAVIKDVPKTTVYRLCEHRNRVAGHDLIPTSVLEKAPSAELRPGQRHDEQRVRPDVVGDVEQPGGERDDAGAGEGEPR